MDIVVKNVTKEYRKDYKKKKIIGSVFLFAISLVLIIGCLLPLAKIGEVSIGNSFNLLIDFIKNAINKESHSSFHLGYLSVVPTILIITAISTLIIGIDGFSEKDNDSMFIDERDLNLKISRKYVIKQILFFLLFTFIYILIAHPTTLAIKRYGASFSLNWCILLACLLFWLKGVVCSYITLRYDEKASFSKSEILNREKEKNTRKAKNEKEKKKGSKADGFLIGLNIMFAFLYIIVAIVGCAVIAFQSYNARFGGFNMIGLNSVAGWVVTPQEEGKLVFDERTLTTGIIRDIDGDSYIGLDFINGVYEDDTKTFTFYGDSYKYSLLKVEELTKEMYELMPKDDTEKALKKYAEEMVIMANAIKDIKERLDTKRFPYERVAFENGYMVDLQYNATGVDNIKWGQKEKGVSSFFFTEKIKLTDFYCNEKKSMDSFHVGTDFSKELIVARVQYSDGSVRISRIKPTNIEELNNAKAGKHLLKWQNSWGEYEIEISIYDN